MRCSAPDIVETDSGSGSGQATDKKRIFILLRYTFIIAAAYLILFAGAETLGIALPLLLVAVIFSNFLLSLLPERQLFAWYIEMPVVLIDTLWISYALHRSGIGGREFFLLYFFVLAFAAIGEHLVTVLTGAVLIGLANLYFSAASNEGLASSMLIRVPFFFTVALFYGHSAVTARRERQQAGRQQAAARQLELVVEERTKALAAKSRELTLLCAQAEEASRLKSEFVASLSHEFLSPLHVVLGYIELLLDSGNHQLSDEARVLLERIQQNASRLLDMVCSVLDFARVDSGKVAVLKSRVDLVALAREVTDARRLRHVADVKVRVETDDKLPDIVTDAEKLKRILANLLSNAVKFTRKGEVVLSVRFDAFAGAINFAVRDTGIGISQEDRAIIFDEFRQLDSSACRRYEGVGLGLAIARRYAELLGGTLTVESTPGAGSCFTFALPCAEAEEERRAPLSVPVRFAHAS
jgi:signal transduction histidine kinase